MQDSVFLDNRTFQRVWQRVAGSMDAPVTTPPEADTLTDLLAECIRAKAAGAAFYCPRLGTAAQDLRCVYTQELKLAERLDAAANTAPSPLRETLSAMAQQDRCHAQAVRNLLACLLG